MPLFIAAVLLGLVVLAVGSDQFVLGAARLAIRLRLRPIIVGAIVIGFGTSAPELVVSGLAAAQGSLDIAVANIAGSNLANVTLVLGFAALVAPLVIGSTTLKREAPLAVAGVSLFAAVLIGDLERWEGVVLLAGLVISIVWVIRSELGSRKEEAEVEAYTDIAHEHPLSQELMRTIGGLVATVTGAQLLVYGAREIALSVGVGEGIIGLTLVAVGTSLPELATVVQAARRNQAELIVGNVLGSNMFNSFGVAGVTAIVAPGPLVDTQVLGTATVLMVAATYLAWFLLRTDRKLLRWEGVLLLAAYGLAVAISAR